MTEYDDLDWLYEVLYAANSDAFYETEFLEQMKPILNLNQRIHDASCGNGIQAVALAKQGFRVSASDISANMVRLTQERAKKAGVSLAAFTASWLELPRRAEKYDVILCYGNSISHSLSKEHRIKNLSALRDALADNGRLVLDTRNWENIQNESYNLYPPREYAGRTFIPIYIWNFNADNNTSAVDIIFIEAGDNTLLTHKKRLTFSMFSHAELIAEVSAIGFEIQADSYHSAGREYTLILKKTAPSRDEPSQ